MSRTVHHQAQISEENIVKVSEMGWRILIVQWEQSKNKLITTDSASLSSEILSGFISLFPMSSVRKKLESQLIELCCFMDQSFVLIVIVLVYNALQPKESHRNHCSTWNGSSSFHRTRRWNP